MMTTMPFFETSNIYFPPAAEKKGFFFSPSFWYWRTFLACFLHDLTLTTLSVLDSHAERSWTPSHSKGQEEYLHSRLHHMVHCPSCLPQNVQSLAQCLTQSMCPINELINTHALTWSQVQLLVLHIKPRLVIYRNTCTHMHTQSHFMHLITHVHLHIYLVQYKHPHGHTILTTHEVAGPCSALNTCYTPAPVHSLSGAWTHLVGRN